MQIGSGIGFPLPDVTLPSLAGGAVRLADLRGTRRLLFMWGSW
jgi:peroxiredoxin